MCYIAWKMRSSAGDCVCISGFWVFPVPLEPAGGLPSATSCALCPPYLQTRATSLHIITLDITFIQLADVLDMSSLHFLLSSLSIHHWPDLAIHFWLGLLVARLLIQSGVFTFSSFTTVNMTSNDVSTQ